MGSQSGSGVGAARSWAWRPLQVAIGVAAATALLIGSPIAAPPRAAAAPEPAPIVAEEILAADADAGEQPVSSDPLPTVQIDGIVYAQAVAGNRVYAGGQFTNARPAGAAPGTQLTPRSNLLAYNLQTGVLDSSFAPQVNGRIMAAAVSPDGGTLYIGGTFTAVNGQARYRLAAFSTATGALLPNWRPGTNSTVFGIDATASTVYFAGQYTNVNNVTRTGVAAVSASNGTLLPFNPVHEGGYLARAIVVAPDGSKVVAAGSFTSTNGSTNPGRGMAALDAVTGASLPWAVNSVIHNGGTNAAIYSLASDDTSVYGSGYDFGGSKTLDDFEGAFRASWNDGAMVWMEDCHGDTYSVAPHNGIMYTASHTHYCGNIGEFPQLNPWYLNHSLAFGAEPSGRLITPDIWGYRSFTGNPAGKLMHWYPTWGTGQVSGVDQAGWSVASAGDYLLYGGEFTSINGVRQQGLVRFTTRDVAPNDQGPVIQGGLYDISTASYREGEARVLWQANHDTDDAVLTYEVYRRGVTAPLHTETAASTYWVRPTMRFSDRTVQSGQTYDYRVRVVDPSGNWTQSDWTSVTVAAAGSTHAYSLSVLDDEPVHYWPMGEASGTTATDWAGFADVTLSGATRGATGQTVDGTTRATTFSGATSSFGSTRVAEPGPQEYSVEAWFRTTSTQGGKIIGFGNVATGTSASYDRHIYLSGTGVITYGNYPGSVRVLQSGSGYNDGAWHHVVGTLAPDGMTLYVDGVRVGSRADTTGAQDYSGYWRIAGDNLNSWPNINSRFLSGTIADVAVYDRALTRSEVNDHRLASGRSSAVPPAPADAYGASVYELEPTLYWRLGESGGTVARDAGLDGLHGSYVRSGTNDFQYGRPGALEAVADTAVGFTSSRSNNTWNNRQVVVSSRSMQSPTSFAIEGWFSTTTTGGGKLIGFGSSSSNATNASTNYDRHIMMTPEGRLQFGVWSGAARVLETTGTYRSGAWHHVVAQQSSSGMQLYVDGELVGSNAVTTADPYVGFWRLGGDTTWVGDPFWVGALDEVAVYRSPLTADQVREHYELATEGVANQAPTASFTADGNGLTVDFDASASSDPEGPIATYAWQFGDGATGTGATPQHVYASGGTYSVTLTVTDGDGVTATATDDVSVQGPNAAPTASFTIAADGLTVSVDGSGSQDPDGSIASYAWDFGGGATATGATASHTYPSSGTRTISLTVTDDRGGTATASEQVTLSAANQAPTASFSATEEGMTVAVDGSGSADADGSIASYAWSFGDGGTATGATASRTYADPGQYTVTLTVTDDDGATATATRTVTVEEVVPADVLARDTFSRTAAGAWGAPDVGPAWSTFYGNAAFSVGDGRGAIALAPSHTREVRMSTLSQSSAELELTFSSDQVSAGGTASVTVIGRQVGTNLYSTRVRLEPTGIVRLYLLYNETSLGSVVVSQTYTAGTPVHVRMLVTGTSPTTLAASVWLGSATEPATWMLQATHTASGMQSAGFVGIRAALSSVSTVPVQTLRFDDWAVLSGQ